MTKWNCLFTGEGGWFLEQFLLFFGKCTDALFVEGNAFGLLDVLDDLVSVILVWDFIKFVVLLGTETISTRTE